MYLQDNRLQVLVQKEVKDIEVEQDIQTWYYNLVNIFTNREKPSFKIPSWGLKSWNTEFSRHKERSLGISYTIKCRDPARKAPPTTPFAGFFFFFFAFVFIYLFCTVPPFPIVVWPWGKYKFTKCLFWFFWVCISGCFYVVLAKHLTEEIQNRKTYQLFQCLQRETPINVKMALSVNNGFLLYCNVPDTVVVQLNYSLLQGSFN